MHPFKPARSVSLTATILFSALASALVSLGCAAGGADDLPTDATASDTQLPGAQLTDDAVGVYGMEGEEDEADRRTTEQGGCSNSQIRACRAECGGTVHSCYGNANYAACRCGNGTFPIITFDR